MCEASQLVEQMRCEAQPPFGLANDESGFRHLPRRLRIIASDGVNGFTACRRFKNCERDVPSLVDAQQR